MINNILFTIRLLFCREKKPYLQLREILGFYPHNIKLYQLALMHKSVSYYEHQHEAADDSGKDGAQKESKKHKNASARHTHQHSGINNERLEFLGDAILGAVVADILYKHYGNRQEGFLTTLRSKIVCRKSLNKLAVSLGLDKLILHAGQITTGHNSYMNGNAFEAFFGAIYLDRGYDYCMKFMEERVFRHHINVELLSREEQNYKSSLIEWCQKRQYTVLFEQEEKREDKTPKFYSTVMIEGVLVGKGEGYSKKESDQNAAREAVQKIKSQKSLTAELKAAFTARTMNPEKEK